MPGYTEWTISLKPCDRVSAQSTNLFLNPYAEKFIWKVVYGLINTITKKTEKTLFTLNEVKCINTKATLVRDLHAADVRCHLDCWLGVTVK